jgi:hypothetical protein
MMLAHEIRMWLMGVIVPMGCIVVTLATNPSCQRWIENRRARRKLKKANKAKSVN